jgi:hypothetical protein
MLGIEGGSECAQPPSKVSTWHKGLEWDDAVIRVIMKLFFKDDPLTVLCDCHVLLLSRQHLLWQT